MKKIINLVKKNIAITLSFAIILCTILPVITGLVGSADSAYDSAKIAELKTAWEELEITETLVPDTVWKTFDTATDLPFNISDSSAYTGTDIDKSLLGAKYLTYTTSGTGNASDNNDYIVFKLLNSSNTYKVSDIKSYSVRYNTTTSNGIRVFMHFMANEGERTIFDGNFLHNPIAVGWSELSYTGVSDRAAFANYQDKEFMGLGFDMTAPSTTVTVGSMTAKFKAVDSATLALATSDADAFYVAAKEFYGKAIANNTFAEDDAKFIRFANAYNALAAEAEKRLKIVEIKNAWANLDLSYEFVPSVVWMGDNNPQTLNTVDASSYAGTDIDKALLGSKYATYSSVGTSAGDSSDFIVFKPVSPINHTFSELTGYSVQYKGSVGINIRPKYLYPKSNTTDQYTNFGNDASYYAAASFGADTWKELTLENVNNPDALKALFSTNASFKDKTVSGIAFDLGGVADVTVGSMTVNFKAVSDTTLALVDTDSDAFIAAAIEFYDNAVENNLFAEEDEDFAKFKSAVEAVADEYVKKLKVAELKAALSELEITEILVPTELWNGSNNIVENGFTLMDSANYAGTDIDKALLGPSYTTYTTTGTGAAADNVDFIVYKFVNPNANYKVGDLDTFKVQMNTTAANVSRAWILRLNDQNQERTLYDSAFVFNHAAGWAEVTSSGVGQRSAFASGANNKLLGVCFDFNGVATTMTLGSMTANFPAVSDETLALADTDADAFITWAQEFVATAEDNGTFASNDAGFLRVKEAVKALQTTKTPEELIASIKETWAPMTVTETLVPTELWNGSNNIVENGFTLMDSANYAGTDIDKALLGPSYTTYTTTGTGAAADNVDFIVYKFVNPNANYKVGDLDTFKVQMNTTAANVSRAWILRLNDQNQERTLYDSAFVFNHAAGWAEVTSSGVGQRSAFASGANNKLLGVCFDFNGVATTMTLGSMTAPFKAVTDETLALADTDAAAFINAAKQFVANAKEYNLLDSDDASLLKMEADIKAYNDLTGTGDDDDDDEGGNQGGGNEGGGEDPIPEQNPNIVALKEALNNLKIVKTLVPTKVWEGTDKESTGVAIFNASSYAGSDIDKAELGSKYATYSNASTTASDMSGFVIYEFEGEENESLNLGRLDNFSFYIKADPSLAAIRPKFGVPTSSGKGWAEDTFAFSSATLGNNEWKKVSLNNVNALSGLSSVLPRVMYGIGLDLSGVANVTVGSMVAEFNALDGATMALADSNPTAFLKAAMEFYDEATLNNYFAKDDANFKAFSEALTAATGLTEDERKVNQLSSAWKSITLEKILVPTEVWSADQVVGEGLNIYDSASYPENDINKNLLGPKYATYSNTDNSASTNEGFILYEFTEPNTWLTLGDVTKYNVYIKSSNEVNGIRPRYKFASGMSWDDSSLFTKGEVGSGTFKNLGKSNIASLGGSIPNTLDRVITGMGFDTAGVTDLTLGSITMEFGFLKEDIASLAYTDMAAFLSEAIIFYEKATANSWFAADNASFNTFKSILEDVLAAESLEELVTIAKLQAGWKQLSNNSSFPEGDTSDWTIADWVYAANTVDVNNLENTEAFMAALNNATILRDELGTTLSCNFTTYETYADAETEIAGLGSNILLGKTPDIYYYNGVEKTEVEVSGSEFLSDGSADNTFNISHLDFSAEGSYTEFVYEFAGEARVKDFVTAFSSDPDLAKMNYRIYVANSMERLFLTESIVASCNNEDGHQVQKFNYDGRPEISGVYLAFRFYPTSNNFTIGELAAYGEVITYTVKAGKFTDEEMKSLGKNLLATPETVCYFKVGNGGRVKWQDNNEMNNGYEYSWLVDLSSEKGVGFAAVVGTSITAVGQETTFHIVFDMKENYNIQQILWNQFHQDHLETGKYEVYASTEIATLFREQNKIITYNNMSDSENGTTDTQLFTLAGNGVVARYVSFCIKCPVSDYEKALEQFSGMCYPRLYDLGVFGTRYYKPLAEINFLNHVPVETYRTDAGGNKTTIKSDEYDGFDYKYAYDGNYDIATPIPQNDKYVNFLFNLCANKSINSIKLSTLTDNIKGLKVYASESEEGVWEENALVLDYYGDAVDEIFRTFGETPIEARYVRFCVTETVDGVFDPTEFEVIGWNTQEFTYFNLAEGKAGNTSLWLEDKETYEYYPTTQDAGRYRPRWWSADTWFPLSAAFDGDEATVADIYNGCNGDADGNGKVSVNFLIDLGTLNSVDNIDFISGSSEEFWPSKINFYFGDNDLALFGEDAELKATFNGKTTAENGSYSYTFIPEIAQYVRVEIEESSNEFFTKGNKIASVIADIRVNGLEILASTASEGVAASITDEETGIRVDLVALRENDVYTTLQDILVVKREATDEEINTVKNNGNRFASDVYEIYLLDANGDIIDDIEGRSIKTYLPSSLYNGSAEAFVMSDIWGEFSLVEFTTEDDYFVVTSDDPININYAFCDFIEAPEGDGDEDPPTNTDKPVEDNNDDNESEVEDSEDTESEDEAEDETDTEAEEEEDDEEETKKKKKKKIKVVRKPGSDDFDYLWIIIAAVAVVVIAAGVTLFIILAKKKKKENIEE